MKEFTHTTVMLEPAVDCLEIIKDGIYVDGTFGRGGHSSLILERLGEKGRLYVFDRDLEAIACANKIQDERIIVVHAPFSSMGEYFQEQQLEGKINGILLDLGVSSPQLDDAERGFSFMRNGPLDMRMDQSKGFSAREWLYHSSEKEIADALYLYGQEKNSRAIAKAIVKLREDHKFDTFLPDTDSLVEVVKSASKKIDPNKNPATRTFQAIRIAVNNELGELEQALQDSIKLLAPHGRISIISFHSLEDRIVKHFFKENYEKPVLPKFLPIPDAAFTHDSNFEKISNSIKPTDEEVSSNPRARSSILRWAQRSSKPYSRI
ncbi:16S rRNA (cytosine(1402)-N(4))-methyltransferase RsmH [Psittacicella gerlachiana]|uniref:Ribosomal RNA small subunit methyltransferase H n=1 Tax=Psittacicella gerlachiana TaxID=2028574 RepID=A0A3A1YKW9_9GAMM|nr:16S rRNA (cytosine(1402)-N(4))-methyltransferase RsmH [Psittacicella gerlachiana]RIY37868.1 16S rRNA (cytosine(1402)-N(4))-methyltransferase [Psittacicella gerlachiana]